MFNDLINENENKKIHKHITIKAKNNMNLNKIQLAYKIEKNRTININELINISICFFCDTLKHIESQENESQALKIIEQYHDKLIFEND